MNLKTSLCRGCGCTITFDGDLFRTRHYCEGPAPGKVALTCRQAAAQKKNREKNQRVRQQSAALNGGVQLRKGDKSLQQKLDKLTVRSYAEVAAEMGISASAVRALELSALEKLRKALMPFRNASSGATKVRQIVSPIASWED